MIDLTMFHRALADFKAAEELYPNINHNRYKCEVCAFHLEQAVEKTLRGYLSLASEIVLDNESVFTLLNMTKNRNSKCQLTEWIIIYSDKLRQWKEMYTSGRSYAISVSDLHEAITHVEKFLKANCVWDVWKEEDTEHVRTQLNNLENFEYSMRPAMEWHILYRYYFDAASAAIPTFHMEDYYKALNIEDTEAEIIRLMNVYHTTDLDFIHKKAKAITELYTNQKF